MIPMQDVVGASVPMMGWRVIPQRVTRWALAAISGFGMSTLVLSMAGVMFPWLVWPIGLAATVGVGLLLPSGSDPTSPATGYVVLALAAAIVTVGWIAPHEHILGARDPGTYVSTATWLARSGSLLIATDAELFGDAPVEFSSPGFDTTADGQRLYPQFMHLFPGLLALAAATFGQAAVFLVNPVIAAVAVLAMYACLADLFSPRIALITCAIVTFSLPFLYFSRAPFSEMASMAFIFGGFWAARQAMDGGSPRHAAGAGLLLGAVFLTRIDGILVLVGLTLYLTWVEVSGPLPAWHPLLRRVWGVACLTALLGVVDGLVFSPVYVASHAEFLGGGLVGMLVARTGGAILRRADAGNVVSRNRGRIAVWLTSAIGFWLVYAWILRPHLEAPTRGDIYGLEGLQGQAGVAVEPLRTYAELSVHWLVWYLGIPLIAFGFFALVSRLRTMIAHGDPGDGPLLTVVAVATLTYLFRPSINPDHIWAMRRFVPVVIPGLVALGVWTVSRLLKRLAGWKYVAATATATALFAMPILLPTALLGLGSELEGGAEAAFETCETLGPDSLLLLVGDEGRSKAASVMPLVRGWCGIPVATERPTDHLSAVAVQEMADGADARGLTLWVVGETRYGSDQVRLLDARFEYIELTLFSRPREWAVLDIEVTAWKAGS